MSLNDLSFSIHMMDRMVSNKPHRHANYQIVWIIGGSGYYQIDVEKYPIEENTVYFIPAGMIQHVQPIGELSGYLVSISPDFLYLATDGPIKNFYKDTLGIFYRVVHARLKGRDAEITLKNLLNEMTQELDSRLLFQMEVLSGLLRVFLIWLQRLMAPAWPVCESRQQVALFNSFYSKVDKHFLTKRQVADYANELSVTPNYLTDVVKRVTGFSASYHIQQRMVLEAKRLAMYSDANMKVIAYQLGFDDISHFSKFFKNAAGITFSGFKKKSFL